MFRVGLTGGIASGKSTVGELFREKGALVLDADAIARYVVEPGTPGLAAVVERFGDTVLRPDGCLDRRALASIVFSDDAARADLNAIVHPLVRQVAADLERQLPDPYVIAVHMIPLLVETGQSRDFDAVVVVDIPEEVQLARLMARDGLDRDAACARLRAQASRDERLAVANVVINNDCAPEELPPRVDAAWDLLLDLQHASGEMRLRW